MSWPKKPKTLKGCQERIEGLQNKRVKFTEDLDRVVKRAEKHEDEIENFLGYIVTGEHVSENEKELAGSRKLLELAVQKKADFEFQLEFVDRELSNLSVEVDEAVLMEVPGEMERVAGEYNQTLDAAIGILPMLQELHDKAKSLEAQFHALNNSRQNALSRLGKTDGLDISTGLGKLAQAPSPFAFVFRAPGELQGFVAALLGYRQKLADYAKKQEANPNLQQEMETIRQEESRGWQWNPLKSVVDRFIG